MMIAGYIFNSRGDQDLHAIQSAHYGIVPRLGGLALFLTFFLFLWTLNSEYLTPLFLADFDVGSFYFLMVSAFPIFFVGLAEDLGYLMSPFKRFLASITSGVLVVWYFGVWVHGIGISIIDDLLAFGLVGLAFTLFATSGVVNAFNLIDGLNGLASFTGISVAIALSYVAFQVNQVEMLRFLFVFSACILGFLLLNFPAGIIFLGDAGAYIIGHVLVWSAIIIHNYSSDVSSFAILLIFFWPVADTILAIWRRKKKNRRVDQPDRLHFHQLVMRLLEIRYLGRDQRWISNPIATIILTPFIVLPQIMGVMFWNNFAMSLLSVIIMTVVFVATYLLGMRMAKRKSHLRFKN